MAIIDKYELFIKEQVEYQERKASYFKRKDDLLRAETYADRAKLFKEMWSEVSTALEDASLPESTEASLHLTPDEIKDLPPELIKELGITDSERKEFLLLELIEKLGGIASINKLLVGIYRETGEVERRTRLVARLYRMQQKGMLYSAPERKGVYSLKPIPVESFDSEEEEDLED